MKQIKKYKVSVFNTFTSQYEEVEVSKEVFDEYRRGLWRIKKMIRSIANIRLPLAA